MFGIAEVDAAGLQDMFEAGEKIRLVDVRSQAEFNQGIIEGAEFLPLHTLPLKLNDFSEDEKIVFYCRTGARSGQACMFVKQNADIEALNLRGGIMAWHQSGHQVVLPQAA